MDILYLLVPLSVLAALGVLVLFAWALRAGQFERIEAEGDRIVFDADQTQPPVPDDRT
jgi:cbb3-type cytochrome oxidase maturation protein